MKVKKFVAPSMPEAMKMIRAELGNDAVILNSKVVHKGGFFGLFTKKNIEVIAAVDPKPVRSAMAEKKGKSVEPLLQRSAVEAKQVADAALLNELNELKTMLKQLSTNVTTNFAVYPQPLSELHESLAAQELSNTLRQEIMDELVEQWYLQRGEADKKQLLQWAKEWLLKKMADLSFGGISFTKKYVNVVGPTGVGKTTTLAKIAAHCVLKHQKKVAFITTDTYRIAAIEQLKTYAKILDVPLEVCYNIDDFREAKKKFSVYDLVFIDTAGRNFRNRQYVQDLREIIDFDAEIETFLVLALTAKYMDMKTIYEQFSLIPIDRFIFTKLDETSQYGAMINLMTESRVGAAYLTNGQNVPDDIVEATPEKIVNTVLGVDGR
ncbi:flagellar biosynthesis protein FlhF [Anoxybacillus voinovskiensis]|uniref:Flagellar biosynthesis protein FlhF n=1 Tax=Anoxybacteroides voinovskiense TaxID=230470 RepID=A0A840DME1_9BACL|nr:flagellar biosynthesis protein FlhF [Anoxybacillus voinovskiensis]MBB4072672.1 flagellar biosynthesis protein FlhF [Anoxybacillus voinovskiensis]GGJ56074.1 flagellar biosynthesis protein FlhF [Anoxybacillus voinovskiensis]